MFRTSVWTDVRYFVPSMWRRTPFCLGAWCDACWSLPVWGNGGQRVHYLKPVALSFCLSARSFRFSTLQVTDELHLPVIYPSPSPFMVRCPSPQSSAPLALIIAPKDTLFSPLTLVSAISEVLDEALIKPIYIHFQAIENPLHIFNSKQTSPIYLLGICLLTQIKVRRR